MNNFKLSSPFNQGQAQIQYQDPVQIQSQTHLKLLDFKFCYGARLLSPFFMFFISLFIIFCSHTVQAEIKTETALTKEAIVQMALRQAIQTGELEELKKVISDGGQINQPFSDGLTPLHVAVSSNQEIMVNALMELGTSVNVKDRATGATPLHLAAVYGRDKIAILLIKRGADVNERMKFGITPLHVATQFRQPQMIQLLLEKNADIERIDDEGFTALHFAAQNSDETCARILLQKGANRNHPDNVQHKTPLMIAKEKNAVELIKVLEEPPPTAIK